ncbi:MAG: ACP S-malonyltransferase [Bacteroidales bacterium]|jgi:[acyl-carrier-protein] S-malonyltransferase|nr:ACP S-malonyltransferase [Bacteroidales bacterium]
MSNKTAFVFPAFITEFTEKELDFLSENSIDFTNYLQRASSAINLDLPEFSYSSNNYRNNELKSQLLAYLFSCAFFDIAEKKGVVPHFVVGYSMGIYASLYAAKSISLEEGVKLIHKAYTIVHELTKTEIYGMGAIIGLPIKDIEYIITESKLDADIININNEHSFVIAGKKKEVNLVLEKAKEEGAMSTVELTVNTPYHSKYLSKFTDSLKQYIDTIPISNAEIPIISTYDQREIVKVSEIKSELIFNLTCKINWYKTVQKLLKKGVSDIYECGAGKDLKKISRFIKGDYRMNLIYKILKEPKKDSFSI